MNNLVNPWKGVAPYNNRDANIFKGRDTDIIKYLRMLHSSVMSVIYANSGVGKTSFINAGIIPIVQESFFVINIVFRDDDFTKNPEALLLEKLKEHYKDCEKTIKHNENITLEKCDSSVWWFLYTHKRIDGKTPLLIFDQFEEVFYKAKKSFLEEFFRIVEELSYNIVPDRLVDEIANKNIRLDRTTRYKAIFALRKEYLSDFDYWTNDKRSCTEFWSNRLPLRPLTREQARKVITEQGVNIFNNVVDNILNDLDDCKEDEVEPILLSVLCHDLFIKTKGEMLSSANYKSEDVKIIIRNFYQTSVNEILGKKRQSLKKFEYALVDSKNGNRKRIGENQLPFITHDEMSKLEKKHLIRRNGDTIELIHDKVAEVVYQRMQEDVQHTQSIKIIYGIIFLFISMTIGIFWFTRYRTIINQWANKSAIFSKIDHPGIWTSTDIKQSGGAGVKREILWNKKEPLYIDGNNSLEKLIIDVDTIYIRSISNCPNIHEITFTNNVKVIISKMGYVGGLSNHIVFNIGDSVQSLDNMLFKNVSNAIINLSDKNPYYQCDYVYNPNYKLNGDSISALLLWDKRDLTINYIGNGYVFERATSLQFPDVFSKKDSVKISLNSGLLGYFVKNDTNYYLEKQLAFTNRKFKEFKVKKDHAIIGEYCFHNCTNLQNIDLCDVKTIRKGAFAECKELREIDLSKVSSIGNLAFQNCYHLSKVIMPNDFAVLGSGAFMGCRNLREVKFPKVLDLEGAIAFSTFRGCTNLTTVYLPDSLTPSSVCTKLVTLFAFCPKLNNINFSQQSHFNWQADSLLCYDDIPVFFNKKTCRPTWCSPDSSYYFEGSLLYKNESYGEEKKGELVDAYLGQGEPVGYIENPARLLLHFYFEDSFIGANDPTLFFPATNDTIIYLKPRRASTYTFINPATQVKEIHVPYVDPWMVGIDISLIPKEKKDIVLYVPWGCKRDYESKAVFLGYKDIREDGLIYWIYNVAVNDLFSFIKDIWLLLFGAVCMTLAYIVCYYRKSNAIIGCIIACLEYYITYWLLFHTIANHISTSYDICRIISICISIILAIGISSLFCKNLFKIYRLSYK